MEWWQWRTHQREGQILLAAFGCEARACYNRLCALEVAAIFLPHVCLIDLNMPVMSGDELAISMCNAPQEFHSH
jgi:CheY-like chemotaxis protein